MGGENNIIIDDYSRIVNCKISITGNNNTIHIGNKVYLEYGEICIEDDNNEILIGGNSIISNNCHMAAIEGTKIKIGENCLFSAHVTVRTGDSHTIFELENEKRINYSKDVIIENHVWVGNNATILKGVHICDNCVIGTNSVVTKSINFGSVVAGNPARVVKQNINWSALRKL